MLMYIPIPRQIVSSQETYWTHLQKNCLCQSQEIYHMLETISMYMYYMCLTATRENKKVLQILSLFILVIHIEFLEIHWESVGVNKVGSEILFKNICVANAFISPFQHKNNAH
jgi:hypothetical protein